MDKLNNTERVTAIRSLFHERPPGSFVLLMKLFRDMDRNLSNNGELPEQWQNARRPLVELEYKPLNETWEPE